MNCKLIKFPVIKNKGGSLAFFEGARHIPFKIKRVFFIYDLALDVTRGQHALKNTQEFIIALRGSCNLLVDNGIEKKRFHLSHPYEGLFMPPMTWVELDNFSIGAICVVFTSEYYNEKFYIRNYKEFKEINKAKNEENLV